MTEPKRFKRVVVDDASEEKWFLCLCIVILASGLAGMLGYEDVSVMVCFLVGGFGTMVAGIMYWERRRVEYIEVQS